MTFVNFDVALASGRRNLATSQFLISCFVDAVGACSLEGGGGAPRRRAAAPVCNQTT